MQTSGFGLIKQIAQPHAGLQETVPAASPAQNVRAQPIPATASTACAVPTPAGFRPGPAAAAEFLRMAGAAVLSGLVFSLVTGLLVFLVANHGQLDAGPSQEGTQISQRP
jgi:multidrug efflux pump subunit AcrB